MKNINVKIGLVPIEIAGIWQEAELLEVNFAKNLPKSIGKILKTKRFNSSLKITVQYSPQAYNEIYDIFYGKKIRELIKRDITKEAAWIGEDGNMVVSCKTELGAIRKFNALLRRDLSPSDIEDYPMSKQYIGTAWFHLVKEENKEKFEDDTEWYVSYKEKSNYPVWIYIAE